MIGTKLARYEITINENSVTFCLPDRNLPGMFGSA